MKRFFLFLSLLLLIGENSNATTTSPLRRLPGIELNTLYSGNGLQSAYVPAFRFNLRDRVGISAGMRFSTNDRVFSGFVAEFRYAVMTEEESNCGKFRLSGFLGTQHFSNEQLSAAAVRMENLIHNRPEVNAQTDYESLRFSGNEIAVGAHGSYTFGFGLFLQARIGIGYYNLHTASGQPLNMTHELSSVTLLAGAGLGWTFSK